jgi:hypothetical protein
MRMSFRSKSSSTSASQDVWELRGEPTIWKRMFSKHWRFCGGNPEDIVQGQCDAVQGINRSSPTLSNSSCDNEKAPSTKPACVLEEEEEELAPVVEPVACVLEKEEKEPAKVIEPVAIVASPLPASRPPLAVRAVTLTAAVATTSTTASLSRGSMIPQSAPPHPKRPSTERAVSYSSTNSRHRRDAAYLPPIQRILQDDDDPIAEQPKQMSVPVTIDRAQCLRSVSALVDDIMDDDDDLFDLSSSSSDEDAPDFKDDTDDASYSPTTVTKPPGDYLEQKLDTATAAATTPDWMLAWAGVEQAKHGSSTIKEQVASTKLPSEVSVLVEPDESSSCASAAASLLTDPCYLPVEPLPPQQQHVADAAPHALFSGGWAAVFWDYNQLCSDEEDAVPHVTAEALYYIQLVEGGTLLRLTPAVACKKAAMVEVPLTRDSRWIVVPVSNRAGCCLSLQSPENNIFILPVHLPARYLEKVVLRQAVKELRNDFFVSAGDEEEIFTVYAPQAQHDAIMHLRFAMDTALLSAFSCAH